MLQFTFSEEEVNSIFFSEFMSIMNDVTKVESSIVVANVVQLHLLKVQQLLLDVEHQVIFKRIQLYWNRYVAIL